VEPKAIQKQQDALQNIKKDIEKVKPDVGHCRQSGQTLMKIIGDQDKPEIKKNIEDLDHAWDNITALFAKREENLIDAMEKAMEFHETLQVRNFQHNLIFFKLNFTEISLFVSGHPQIFGQSRTAIGWIGRNWNRH
jgi:hypothetical protein